MDKADKRILAKLNGANVAFFLCDKLRADGNYMCEDKLINGIGDEFENCEVSLVYMIQKLFYISEYYEPRFNVSDIVRDYIHVFKNEMTSKEQLISMLME